MSSDIYLLTLALLFGTILFIFAMKYASAAFAARARIAGDTAYRLLAERAVTVQTDNQAMLSALQSEVSQLGASLAAVERILKQVE